MSDEELIANLAHGNGDALTVLVNRYQRLVFSIALRFVKDAHEAENVTQNVFLEIFRKASMFDPKRGPAKTWLMCRTYSRSIDYRDKLVRQRCHLGNGGIENTCYLSDVETGILVRELLCRLPIVNRRAVTMVLMEGFTLRQAAVKCGCGFGALRHRFDCGMAKLREIKLRGR